MSTNDVPATAGTTVMAKAESEATVEAALDLKSTVLIGIFGKPESLSALLRSPDGSIVRIARGDKTSVGTVVGIDVESVRVQKAGRVLVMRMPKT